MSVRISLTLEASEMFLPLHMIFSLGRATVVWAIVERISGFDPSLEMIAPRYLKFSTSSSLWNEKLEVVPEFCYLGDMLSAGGGCELAAITRCKCAWGKFRQLLPLLTNRHLPLLTRGQVYSSCVRSVMLHAAETWAKKVDTLNRPRRNDRAMIRWICNVRAKDKVSSDSLLTKLGIQDLDGCSAPVGWDGLDM